ncbi:hypothetical protein F511_41800 [Dorcoceras hygrometricum]|uniref:Uncharacterized protein n=1 Tax=Dorcoceras hygrometricum TaxID=472368 RepID=A0A2Z7CA80_9LAMI|nr:hypothetical protein F511_41800 [Dorcoceras hygrometricum]
MKISDLVRSLRVSQKIRELKISDSVMSSRAEQQPRVENSKSQFRRPKRRNLAEKRLRSRAKLVSLARWTVSEGISLVSCKNVKSDQMLKTRAVESDVEDKRSGSIYQQKNDSDVRRSLDQLSTKIGNTSHSSVCTRRADEFGHGWNLLVTLIETSPITKAPAAGGGAAIGGGGKVARSRGDVGRRWAATWRLGLYQSMF